MSLQHAVNLAGYTSLHAGGPAENFLELESGDNLQAALEAVSPIWVLGFGTNVLISDKGLPGTVIINKVGEINIEDYLVTASSGANWDELVQKTIAQNLWGLEFTSGIPGSVGAAIAGNIAAYGHKVSDVLANAKMLDTQTGQVSTWRPEDFGFDYRTSVLQKPENSHMVVLEAEFKLNSAPSNELEYDSALKVAEDLGVKPDSLSNRRQVIMEARRRAGSLLNEPGDGHWTAGSFFKNPLVSEDQIQAIISHEEHSISRDQLIRQNVIHGGNQARVSAAHVLLAAGFARGQTWGNVRLHPQHILKLENTGQASAQEIYDVVQEIISTVHQKLNIKLEPEVRFLGEF